MKKLNDYTIEEKIAFFDKIFTQAEEILDDARERRQEDLWDKEMMFFYSALDLLGENTRDFYDHYIMEDW